MVGICIEVTKKARQMMACIRGLEHLEKEGWEAVAVDYVSQDEWYLDGDANPRKWLGQSKSCSKTLIVRKIVKPDKYRPFVNAEEYLPHWGKPIRTKGDAGFDSVASTSEGTVYVNSGTARARYTMAEAFEQLIFADGTPFGVKVQS
jgi:hypothetical protein